MDEYLYDPDKRVEFKRPSWDEYFIGIAEAVSLRSHDAETKVGCVIVKDNRIISTGYNGFPPGAPDHEWPNKRPNKYAFMVHAEINAIASCSQDMRGSILYCTLSPCEDCIKAIITAGCDYVIYSKPYERSIQFVTEFARRCSVGVHQLG